MASVTSKYLKQHAKRLKYEEELIEPIVRRPPRRLGLLGSTPESKEDTAKRQNKDIKDQSLNKLGQLFSHYGLDAASSDDSLVLALRLALDWVPGFVVTDSQPRKRGAPKVNDNDALAILAIEIEQIRAENESKPSKWVCGEFLDRHESDPRWKGMSYRTIEILNAKGTKILEARRNMAKLFERERSNFGLIGGSYNKGGLMALGEAAMKAGLTAGPSEWRLGRLGRGFDQDTPESTKK